MENRMEKLIKNIGHLSFRLPEDYVGLDEKNRAVMLDDVISLIKEFIQGPLEVDWIPCKKRLPDTGDWEPTVIAKEYLVTYAPDEVSKYEVGIRYFCRDTQKFKSSERVVAWCEIPEEYKDY